MQLIDPLWPSSLRLPPRPPQLIYLDLNHWISLAKALSGHPEGIEYRTVLDTCIKAVEDGKAVFPVSEFFYAEISKIPKYQQRRNLRNVVEIVSRYVVVTPLSVVATHGIEAVLDQFVGPNPRPVNAVNYLDWGVNRAFGTAGGFRIESISGEDVTDDFRQSFPQGPEAFDAILVEGELELNRKVIDGPTPHEETDLRKKGWNPEAIIQAYEQKAFDERAQVARFDDYPKWRSGRIRDALMAREICIEVIDILNKGISDRGGNNAADKFFSVATEDFRKLLSSMPSLDVAATLKASLHRDARHLWENNDVYDIKALETWPGTPILPKPLVS